MESPAGAWRVGAVYYGSGTRTVPKEKPPNSVRLVCQSDTHAKFEPLYEKGEATVPDGDVYIHAGDFTELGMPREIGWFKDYVSSLPHRHKIVIAGNHDLTFHLEHYAGGGQRRFHYGKPQDAAACKSILTSAPGITYLEDSGCEVLGLKVWGSPWQPEFYDWAFNCSRGEAIRKYWDLIPDRTDVLITHGPPLGHGDMVESHARVGCEELIKAVERVKPLVHVFGHIHEGYGVTSAGPTTFVNASTCTFRYRPTNPCVVVDLIRD